MPTCAAYGCTNRSNEDKTLSFHKVPSEKNSSVVYCSSLMGLCENLKFCLHLNDLYSHMQHSSGK